MTKKEMWTAVSEMAEVKANEEILNGVLHEIELLSKPRKRSDKPTKKQLENLELLEKVKGVVAESDTPMTAKAIGETLGFSSQKASSLIRLGGDTFKREVVKGTAVFSIA